MSSPSPYEIATAVAAVISAIGGAFAAVAAFRSAATARDATRQAEEAERRVLLREVSTAAASIQAVVLGVSSRGQELLLEYRSAEVFSGSSDHSGLRQLRESTENLIKKARFFVEDAQLFSGGAKSLSDAPVEEVERVRTRLAENFNLLQVIREELDRKYLDVASKNMQHRQVILQARR
ncbi:hypothetical protein [Thiobacillus denitrificans]|uniref:hypothetical protein n=1 Tax=Thiobacillus denitrificans TaxID=36861 RepID=UPI0014613A42|nr:hypothetical protein [Thiobacillus denitrificans]